MIKTPHRLAHSSGFTRRRTFDKARQHTQQHTIGLAPRAIALRELRAIHQGKRLNLALDNVHKASLPTSDTSLARHLLLSSLRYHWAAQAIFLPHCQRPPAQRDLLLLVLGCVSLVWLQLPAHAVLQTTVTLAGAKSRNFIHAILQRIHEEWADDLHDTAQRHQRLDRLILNNAPDWWIKRWRKHWPCDADNILRGHAQQPVLDICFKNKSLMEKYAQEWHARPLWGYAVRHHGNPTQLSGFDQGDWWVQDWAAQWPVWLARHHIRAAEKEAHILDMCAAPGGKTAQILAHMPHAHKNVTALDQDQARLHVLRANMRRLGYAPTIVKAKAENWQPATLLDIIFLDAPCSASGTIRRHPDILLRDHDTSLTRQQTTLLKQAVRWLKPGGVLLYSVCSTDPAEGWHLLGQWQDELGLQPLPFATEDQAILQKWLRPERLDSHQLQTLPADAYPQGGMDGFYIGCFQRPKQ